MKSTHAIVLGAAGLAMALAAPAALAQAIPGNKNILVVCGNENNTVSMCKSIDDITLKNRLEVVMGHHVTMMGHDTDHAVLLKAANEADLVIIPESVLSGRIGTALVSTPTPILSSEAFLQDEFGFITPPFVPVDPGYPGGPTTGQLADAMDMLEDMGIDVIKSPPPGNTDASRDAAQKAYRAARDAAAKDAVAKAPKPSHGTTVGQMDVVITDPSSPLAAGLTGRVHVYRYAREMNWGAHLAPGVKVVATLAPPLEAAGDAAARTSGDYSGAAVIYYVPKGGKLADGSSAAGLRVQFFVENENGPGTYNLMTPAGFRLFDAAINFAFTGK